MTGIILLDSERKNVIFRFDRAKVYWRNWEENNNEGSRWFILTNDFNVIVDAKRQVDLSLHDYFASTSFEGELQCLNNSCIVVHPIGMMDKNGVDIYEGDICRCVQHVTHGPHEDFRAEVYWDVETCGFLFGKEEQYTFIELNSVEVIGNIVENPELLKECCPNQEEIDVAVVDKEVIRDPDYYKKRMEEIFGKPPHESWRPKPEPR